MRPPLRRNPRLIPLPISLSFFRPSTLVRRSPRLYQSAEPFSSVSNIYYKPFDYDPPYLKSLSKSLEREELRDRQYDSIYRYFYSFEGPEGLNIIFRRGEYLLSTINNFKLNRVFRYTRSYRLYKRL